MGRHWVLGMLSGMTEQLAIRLSDEVLAGLDDLVRRGRQPTRTAAVRAAVESYVEAERRRAVGDAIVRGYRAVPQTDEELAVAQAAALRSIAEEPW